MLVTNCCGASNRSNGDNDYAEFGICPECKEHCEFVEDFTEEENEEIFLTPKIKTDEHTC